MSKQYSWAEVRESAAEAFGGHYPDAELEQELLEVFRDRPAFVVDAIENVKRGFASGRIHSPWLLLRQQTQRPDSELVVKDEGEKTRRVANAEQWLRVAGLYFRQRSEVVDELFGSTGRLRDWGSDSALVARMVALWEELRPAGVALETEAAARIAAQLDALERARGHKLRSTRKGEGAVFAAPGVALGGSGDDWVGEEPPLAYGAAPA